MEFEWDSRKAKTNIRDHGVTFEEAERAFLDPGCICFEDMVDEYGERRYHLIGSAEHSLLILVVQLTGLTMAKPTSDSSQQEELLPPNETFIVRRTLKLDDPASTEMLAHLKQLAEMPDELIRTDLIPELPREAWKRAKKNPWAKLLREQVEPKAS